MTYGVPECGGTALKGPQGRTDSQKVMARSISSVMWEQPFFPVLTKFERHKIHSSKSTKQLSCRETEFAKDLRSVTFTQFSGRKDLFELRTDCIDSRGKDLNFTR